MAQELLAELHQRGIRLRLTDGRLDVLAPAGALTAELHDRLKEERDNLVASLRGAETADSTTVPRISPRPAARYEPFPLTDIQHAYWVGRGTALELGGVSTHIYFELERTGLDPDRLRESLRRVITRHDMLRAVVQPDGMQRVLQDVPPYEFPVADLREEDPAAIREWIDRTREEMGHQVLPADRWPLFDIRASLHPGGRLRLHISLDTLILDWYSMYLLFQDWQHFYEAPDWSPEPLELSYRDIVLAQQEAEKGPAYRRAEQYWMERVGSLAPAPGLPLKLQPSQLSVTEFRHRAGVLPQEKWERVKERARRCGLTPSAVLLTCFGEVLRLWSAQERLTLDVTLFNRPQNLPEAAPLIGDFTSVTLLTVSASPGVPFVERARQVQQQLLQDLAHSDYSGVRVMRELARRSGRAPGALMPVVFSSALALGSGNDHLADGMRFFGDKVYGITQTPQVTLDHQVTDEGGELQYNWDAVEALFPDGMLGDMFATYTGILEQLADEDGAWESPLGAVPPSWQLAEREDANATETDIPQRTLCSLVEEQAARSPEAVAVLDCDGAHTYRETTEAANRLAHRLQDIGGEPDSLIAVVLDKGWEQVAAVLGVIRSSSAYLPLDPGWPAARRDRLLERGRVRTVVTSDRLRDALDWPDGVQVVTLDDSEVQGAPADPPDAAPQPSDLAYVIFTSGSTGEPKGVMIDHRGAANTVQDINRRFALSADDRVLALSSLSFDLSVFDIFGPLAAGGALVMPDAARTHDPLHWAELIERHAVTVWNSVPTLMQAAVDASPSAADDTVPESSLRLVLLSGDWIPVSLPDAVRAQHPAAEVISLGGATEASIWSVARPVREVPPTWTRIPYGRPLANQTMHVYGSDFEDCPVWTPGEIHIGGVGVARGYWADEEKTNERFVHHPDTGERLYRTGDLGRYLPGGELEFLGRLDHQVKVNGYRIELGEIEAALREQPQVADAVVTVDTNPSTGARHLVACVVPAHGGGDGAPPSAELRASLEEELPSYLVPRHYLLLDEIPLSGNGKVDRSALPSPWEQYAPPQPVSPENETEKRLLEMWRDVLGRDDFGVEDNFFELGGDSLHAVRILSQLRAELGILQEAEDDLEMLFDFPTIAELAAALTKRRKGEVG